jgi:hypothetical protein
MSDYGLVPTPGFPLSGGSNVSFTLRVGHQVRTINAHLPPEHAVKLEAYLLNLLIDVPTVESLQKAMLDKRLAQSGAVGSFRDLGDDLN